MQPSDGRKAAAQRLCTCNRSGHVAFLCNLKSERLGPNQDSGINGKTMSLRALIIADPVLDVATLIQAQCQRLAQHALVATSYEQLLILANAHKPEVIVVSLELLLPQAREGLSALVKMLPQSLLFVAYRELSLPEINALKKIGIQEFIAHPVQASAIFRAVSHRFAVPVRQHPRFDVQIDVLRADGVQLGQTGNLSLGGMQFFASVPVRPQDSLLVTLHLDGQGVLKVRFRVLLAQPLDAGRWMVRGQFEHLRGQGLQQLATFLEGKLEAP